MAFLKTIENPKNGNKPAYWRLVHIGLDVLNKVGTLVLAGYTDRQFRDMPDGVPVDQRSYQVPPEEFIKLYARHIAGENLAALSYEYIQTVERMVQRDGKVVMEPSEFADAERV